MHSGRFFRRLGDRQSATIGLLALSLGAAASLRVFLLVKYSDLWFCSDEANIGLMALRFVRHGEISIFTPGVTYGGFLGPAVVAVIMLVTGSPFLATKLSSALFFLLFCVALYGLAGRVAGRTVALVSVALVCFSPMFLTQLTTRHFGPHPETLFMGTMLMWLTLVLTGRESGNSGRPWYRREVVAFGAWGFLAGLAWYTYYLAVTYIFPCGVVLAVSLLRASAPNGLVSSVTTRRLLKLAGAATAGLLVGSLPYWVFVAAFRVLPPFDSNTPAHFDPLLGLRLFYMVGFPIVVGARKSWSRLDLVPVFSKAIVYFYLISVAWFATSSLAARRFEAGRLLVTLHLLAYPIIFAVSSFSNFVEQPRYLLGLYSSLPVVLAWAIVRTGVRSKILAGAVMVIVASVSVYGNFQTTPEEFNTIFSEPNAPVIRFLRQQKIRHFYANFWIAYRVMFESAVSVTQPPPDQERLELIASTAFGVRAERDVSSTAVVNRAPDPAYVAWESEAPDFEKKLTATGRRYAKKRIGRYVVFYAVSPRLPAPPWD